MTEGQNQHPLSELIVEKRSGNSEKFEEEKLVRGISRAGTPFMLAKDISKSIINKLKENPPIDNFIYSSKIREYVTQELKQRNQNTIAESFAGYSKNNITSIKEEQLKNNKYDSKVLQTKNTQSKQLAKDKDNTSGRGTKTGLQ
ncbi:transcriptional regulator NrdR [Candidatus Nitrosocosmicus oleophilus]|uniref:Transcriptional regulator NrdR n=1 Tax=Candidatus Nitrosocosmicus oleophilus TaxID=1353260 RepID=A0A654LV25_9ARCH|nr:ATP cone domain-containing protein [Candidatus Nitrosocosmicus oleophilus]ALI35294.1 transcriptional regulator NrdR [Candidatus Nitrosocosmicus oleophilus]